MPHGSKPPRAHVLQGRFKPLRLQARERFIPIRGGTDGVKLTKSTAKGGIQLANPNGTPKLTVDGKAYAPNGTTNGGNTSGGSGGGSSGGTSGGSSGGSSSGGSSSGGGSDGTLWGARQQYADEFGF